jgi:Ca2+-binding EF-hand superfamily protein
VNAVTFLSFLIVLAAGEDKVCLTQRLEALFHLVDFSNSGSISRDDLTILLLSIETAIRVILMPKKLPDPTQCRAQMAALIEIANSIGKIKGRKLSPTIKQNEFTEFIHEFLVLNLGDALCIDEVHRLLSGTGETPEFPHDKK